MTGANGIDPGLWNRAWNVPKIIGVDSQLFISRWHNNESITLVFIWNPLRGGKDIRDGVRLGHGFTLLLRYNIGDDTI